MNTKEYLMQAMLLEKRIYEQKQIISEIQTVIKKLEKFQYREKLSYEYYDPSSLKKIKKYIIIGGCVSMLLLTFSLFPVYIIASICLYKYLLKREQEKVSLQNKQIDEKNLQIEKNNKLIRELNQTKLFNLRTQLKAITENLTQTKLLREKLYNFNILHPKYRNFVSVHSLYEYFDTGRCTELTGHEGAYNVYENEIRLSRITEQLDIVICNLEEIKANQYMLYVAISESNRSIKHIYNTLEKISSATNSIVENTEITAYNSRIAAQNLQALTFIKLYENIID